MATVFISHLSDDFGRNLEKRLFLEESKPYTLFNVDCKLIIKRVAGLNNQLLVGQVEGHLEFLESVDK